MFRESISFPGSSSIPQNMLLSGILPACQPARHKEKDSSSEGSRSHLIFYLKCLPHVFFLKLLFPSFQRQLCLGELEVTISISFRKLIWQEQNKFEEVGYYVKTGLVENNRNYVNG